MDEDRLGQAAEARHQEQGNGVRGDEQRVGDRHDGRRVDEGHVVALLGLIEELGERLAAEELVGVRRQRTGQQDVQVEGVQVDDDILQLGVADQDIAESLVGHAIGEEVAEGAMEPRTTEVEIHEEDAAMVAGEAAREVDDGEGLALAGDGAGDGEDAALASEHGEVEAGADVAERLVDRLLAVALEEFLLGLVEVRHAAEDGRLRAQDANHVGRAGDLVVHEDEQDGDEQGERQAADGRAADDLERLREEGGGGLLGDADAADGEVAEGGGVGDLELVETVGDHGDGLVELGAGGLVHPVVAAELVEFDELRLDGVDLLLVLLGALELPLLPELHALEHDLELLVHRLADHVADDVMDLDGDVRLVVLGEELGLLHLVGEKHLLEAGDVLAAAVGEEVGEHDDGALAILGDLGDGGANLVGGHLRVEEPIGKGAFLGDEGAVALVEVEDAVLLLEREEVGHGLVAVGLHLLQLLAQDAGARLRDRHLACVRELRVDVDDRVGEARRQLGILGFDGHGQDGEPRDAVDLGQRDEVGVLAQPLIGAGEDLVRVEDAYLGVDEFAGLSALGGILETLHVKRADFRAVDEHLGRGAVARNRRAQKQKRARDEQHQRHRIQPNVWSHKRAVVLHGRLEDVLLALEIRCAHALHG